MVYLCIRWNQVQYTHPALCPTYLRNTIDFAPFWSLEWSDRCDPSNPSNSTWHLFWSQKRWNGVEQINNGLRDMELIWTCSFLCFCLTGRSFPKEAESIDHHTWFLAKDLLCHKLLRGFRCSTNFYVAYEHICKVLSFSDPPTKHKLKEPSFQCLGS